MIDVEDASAVPRMVVFGATEFATALCWAGRFLGRHVTLCDARPTFATSARFPDAHEVVVMWPHRYLAQQLDQSRLGQTSALAVLTHDQKFDVPLLQLALSTPSLGYVGAMGSRRLHDERLAELRRRGLTASDLARLHSPIGLDLGASTPRETAISIVAEMLTVERARTEGQPESVAAAGSAPPT